jgi:hypothetical protein
MPEQTVLIIRHADKPEPQWGAGVDKNGTPDDRSLTTRGWARAGVWADLFVPSLGSPSALPTPATIFASAHVGHHEAAPADDGSKSRRPEETITPLAEKLGVAINLSFTKGGETALATALAAVDGVTLVCWQHEDIIAIARALAPNLPGLPAQWPGDRYNVIFRFQRADRASSWNFDQIVPVMLTGDLSGAI